MKTYEIIEKVHDITEPEWKIHGEYKRPDQDRIILMLVNQELALRDQGDLSQIESGGILMRKDGKHIDVFVHVGELDLDE